MLIPSEVVTCLSFDPALIALTLLPKKLPARKSPNNKRIRKDFMRILGFNNSNVPLQVPVIVGLKVRAKGLNNLLYSHPLL